MKKFFIVLACILTVVACNQTSKEEIPQQTEQIARTQDANTFSVNEVLCTMQRPASPECEELAARKRELYYAEKMNKSPEDIVQKPKTAKYEEEPQDEEEMEPELVALYEELRAASMEDNIQEVERIITAIKEQNPEHLALYEKLRTESKEGNLQEVKKLIAEGANVNYLKINEMFWRTEYKEDTPLTLASRNNHLQVVEELVKAGATDKYADSFKAACKDDTIDIAVFLAKSISYRRDPSTILRCASMIGNVELLNISLEEGADVNTLFEEAAISPLIFAATDEHKEVVQALIDAGADVNYSTDDYGISVLFYAAGFGKYDYIKSSNTHIYEFSDDRIEIIQALIKAGADVNHKNEEGQTVLAYIQDRITDCTGERDVSSKCIIKGMETLDKIIELLKQAGVKE